MNKIEKVISKAKELLNKGDAQAALDQLESYAKSDSKPNYRDNPEFYGLIWVCEESLGLKHHNSAGHPGSSAEDVPLTSRILQGLKKAAGISAKTQGFKFDSKNLNWLTARIKGAQLLAQGKPEESIPYFRFAINDNPGEAGTASELRAAEEGIKTAEAMIRKMKSTDTSLKRGKK